MMKGFLVTITAVACMVALAAFVIVSDGSDADSVETPVITIFSPESESYASMAYRGDALPDAMSATRYTKNADDYWYNTDYGSSYNGSYLTYGELVPQMSVEEIRADLESRFGAGYLVVQVSFKVNEACNVSYKIYKGGVAYVPTQMSMSMTVNDMDCHSVRYVKQFQVGTDFVPGSNLGTYTLDVKCDGEPVGTDSENYNGGAIHVTGYVKDLSGRGISDAVVYYTRSDSVISTAITNQAGLYTIPAVRGETIKVTSVTKSDFNFSFAPHNTGDLDGDYVVPDIFSQERTVLVNVTDRSGTYPLGDVIIFAEWYMENQNPVTGKYELTKKATDIITSHTGADGNAYIICKDPSPSEAQRYALFVYAQSSDYTFDLDEDFISPSEDPFNFKRRAEPGSQLVCRGDDFADLANPLATVALRCEDSCIEVTVRGALDAYSYGGAPLRDIRVTAEWYYQVERSTGYEYSTNHQSEFGISVEGKAFPVTTMTGEDGRTIIAYIIPQWTPVGIAPEKLKAYLYVHYTGTNALYAFDVMSEVPPGGSSSFPDIVAPHKGSVALDSTAVADTEIRSSDVAYTVSGTIAGTFPSEITLSYSIYQNVESLYTRNATVDTSVSPATFRYTVKAGMYSKITVLPVEGYSFSPSNMTVATMTGDANVSITASEVTPVPYARSVPEVIKTYTVEGLSEGDYIQLTVTVAGTTVLIQRTSTGTTLVFPVYGHPENKVSSASITGSAGLFIPALEGDTITVARIVKLSIVTFADGSSSIPTTSNVTPSATIRATYDGGSSEVKTSATGTAVFDVPEGYPIVYKFIGDGEQYSVTGTLVADGPFAGRVAINLHGLVDVDTEVVITLTEQRVAYSSLFNTSPAEATVLSTETMSRVVGKTVKFTAPEISGFEFSGWYLGNTCVSENRDMEMMITEDHDGKKLSAVYGALPEEIPEEGIEPTTLMIGLVAIMIAIICFAYVVLQNKRY